MSLTPTPLVATFSYNAIGNLTFKSDVGAYNYPAPGQPRPHGVSSVTGGSINATFTYDAKGNLVAGNGLTVTYTASNKAKTITRGTATVTFDHDPEHQRFAQTGPNGVTPYLSGMGVLAERFGDLLGPQRWTNYLIVGGRLVGIQVENADETTLTRYFHTDHLGSIAVITDETGTVTQRLSYDAWGLRRHPDGTPDPAGAIQSESTRGFTGHEHLAEVGLIHMNGRVYDPLLARFGTPDPMTEDPYSTQGWNRYSYVGNSPVNFTDPSGYCFLGCFWKPLFKAIGNFFREHWGTIVQIAAAAMCPPGLGPVCAAVAATVVTGITSGDLGMALRAGATAFATAMAFQAVGTAFPSGTPENIAGHALVGCISAVMGRGRCGPGALSAGISAAAGPMINGVRFSVQSLVANAVVGGLASVAGGGKFANGAITAAYGYLFNYLSHVHRSLTLEAMGDTNINWQRRFDLANAVADVDWLPGSQDADHAHMHGMCTAGEGVAACTAKIDRYEGELWRMKSLQGLAGLLHLLQDSYAPGHIGFQEWNGCYTCDIPGTLKHLWDDGMPPYTIRNMIVEDSRRLILNYDKHCGSCISKFERLRP